MSRAAIALQPDSPADESLLVARVLGGDRAAGRALYDAHAPRIYRLVFRLAGDEDLARDFTQDAFIKAFAQLPHFRGESAFGTWLHRIAVTVALNGMRRVRRFRTRETALDDAHPIAAAAVHDRLDLRTRLARALEELPEQYRVPLVMHDVEGYTHAEIAGVLGIPEGTCKTRLASARARMREALADYAEE
jgi:RNA polymerase sigma-70 factor (ECF subfamily)